MNENAVKLIEQLANKLGTTSEYLWGILLKQAPISSTISLITISIVALIGIALYKCHKYFMQNDTYDTHDITGLVMLIITILYLFAIAACIFAISNIVSGYFHPEYWALNQILQQLK